MRAYLLLTLTLAACSQIDPNGIYQVTMTGDIAVWRNGYCGSGTINASGQVQIADDQGTISGDVSTSCLPVPCDNIPCGRILNFHCTFADNGDATCTPQFSDSNPIGGVFALGKCTSTSCSIMSPTIDNTYSNVDIEMTRQR